MCRLTEMKLYNSTVSVMLTVEMCVQTVTEVKLYNSSLKLTVERCVQTGRGELYGCDSDHGDVCADWQRGTVWV